MGLQINFLSLPDAVCTLNGQDFLLIQQWPLWFERQFFGSAIGKTIECWGKPDSTAPPLLFSGAVDGRCLVEMSGGGSAAVASDSSTATSGSVDSADSSSI